jgi:hypothetical protein
MDAIPSSASNAPCPCIGFLTSAPLDMIGRYVCDYQASLNIWQKYVLAWYIIFISVEIWNAKYVTALLAGPTKLLL